MAKGFVATASITVQADAGRIWRALTDPGQIKQYLFGTTVVSDWVVGSPILYRGSWEGKPYEDKGTIVELTPPTRFVSTYWSSMGGKPDLPENYSTVSYELTEHDGVTDVSLTQDNNDTEAGRDHAAANWQMVLEGLKKLVEG